MQTDSVFIITCIALLLAAIATPACNALVRLPARHKRSGRQATKPSFSIIMTAHNAAPELERNLPLFLSQDYDPAPEVIVVNESSTDSTDDVLKRLRQTYPNLYTTFIPNSSHYISRKKLAMTIGVKAAHNDWVIFTDTDCRPNGEGWLSALATHCTDGTDIVLGYTNYEQDAKRYYRFERLLNACHSLWLAGKGWTYSYNGHNLAIRRKAFIDGNGFLNNLKYLRGEYDFLANDYATPQKTDTASEPEAHVIQDKPTPRLWRNRHIYYMETRKHLHGSLRARALSCTDNILLHGNYLFEAATFAFAVSTNKLPLACAAAIAFALTLTLRTLIAKRALRHFGESLPPLLVPLMEVRVAWQNLAFIIRHKLADKNDFIRNN